jgi:hypothetical protein
MLLCVLHVDRYLHQLFLLEGLGGWAFEAFTANVVSFARLMQTHVTQILLATA